MKKEEIVSQMVESKIIPLFYEGDIATAKQLVDACYAGGARAIEFTNRGEKAEAVFAELVTHSTGAYPDLAMGIGSIANVEQAERFTAHGADFLVSPFILKELADYGRENGILWTGGCGTLTEMQTAWNWGVQLVKAFPGSSLGPGFIKAVKAPCPWLRIMPTGGVSPDPENLKSWFSAGASCVGMGSKLFVRNANGAYDYPQITALLKASIDFSRSMVE